MSSSPITSLATSLATPAAPQTEGSVGLNSLFDMVLDGGPLMVPIALASVVALGLVVERSIRLRDGELGSKKQVRAILELTRSAGPSKALALCSERSTPLGRILATGLRHARSPFGDRELAVEDAGTREAKRLTTPLRPLVLVSVVAPLLGLLGTVWGMIQAFSEIAGEDAIGKPELLAGGISQALITTAAGLSVAIPTQAAIFWLRGKIDRFVRRSEDAYLELSDLLCETEQESVA